MSYTYILGEYLTDYPELEFFYSEWSGKTYFRIDGMHDRFMTDFSRYLACKGICKFLRKIGCSVAAKEFIKIQKKEIDDKILKTSRVMTYFELFGELPPDV